MATFTPSSIKINHYYFVGSTVVYIIKQSATISECFLVRTDEDITAWFDCDQFTEEISKEDYPEYYI